eukprot:scaffold28681_cov129-Isochrysis_galbana.AAC.1
MVDGTWCEAHAAARGDPCAVDRRSEDATRVSDRRDTSRRPAIFFPTGKRWRSAPLQAIGGVQQSGSGGNLHFDEENGEGRPW